MLAVAVPSNTANTAAATISAHANRPKSIRTFWLTEISHGREHLSIAPLQFTQFLCKRTTLLRVTTNQHLDAASRRKRYQPLRAYQVSAVHLRSKVCAMICHSTDSLSRFPPRSEVPMSRTVKIIGIVIVVLILIVVIAPFLIPVNSFRPQIEQQASAALGRKVEIGNLSLSLFSGSLGADNLSIADDPKFSSAPFLTAKSFNVGVEVMPLITSKTLNVTSVVIDGPQVSLIRNAAGDWNYSTLGASPTKTQSQAAPAPAAPAGQAAKPSAPASAPPAGAPPAFTIQKLELKNGQITVSSVGSAKKSSYSNLNVTASNVSLVSKFPITV